MANEQFDIFGMPTLDERFSGLPGVVGTQSHAKRVTQLAADESLPVWVAVVEGDEYSHRVGVVGSNYCLNAFNCEQGAATFISRHGLQLRS